MIRPSNSGRATDQAVSSGDSPTGCSSQAARLVVAATAWTTGTSSRASTGTSHESASGPAWPMASTVVTTASTLPSRKRETTGTSPRSSGRSE